jgi:hypothetical protein
MTTQEIISRTGYTEQELLKLALGIAARQAQIWRDNPDDAVSREHNDNLYVAFATMRNEIKEPHQ